jgi:bacillithiol system protein YtxJ
VGAQAFEDSQSFLDSARTIVRFPFRRQQEKADVFTATLKYVITNLTFQRGRENMGNKFLRIDDRSALDNLLSDSKQKPVILFKHSNACPISARAYREMEKLDDVNLLEIQVAPEISREVEKLTGVRHESPQVILLRDGKAVWDASHFDVNAASVSQALESNG